MSSLDELSSTFIPRFEGKINVLPVFRGETTWVVDRSVVFEVLKELKASGFDYLIDISSVDNSGSAPRFEVVYELFSYTSLQHLRVKCAIEEDGDIPSVTPIWRTANWHEREAWDMMGIRFSGHPDLRRILMWEGYPYHPLRKEFPLEGKPTEMPDIAFTRPAPLEGGPFVTAPAGNSQDREPQARPPALN